MYYNESENRDFIDAAREGKIVPSSFVWNKIEATLKEKRKRRVFVWGLYPGLFLLICIGIYAFVLTNYGGNTESKQNKGQIAKSGIVKHKDSQYLNNDEFVYKLETYFSSKNEKLMVKDIAKNALVDNEQKKITKSQPKTKALKKVEGEKLSSFTNYNDTLITETKDSYNQTLHKQILASHSSIILDSFTTNLSSVKVTNDSTNRFKPTIMNNEKLKWLSISLGAGSAGGNFTTFNDETINLPGKSFFLNGGIYYHFNKSAFKAELNYLMVRSNVKLNSPTLSAFGLQSDPSTIIISPPKDTNKGHGIKINEVLLNFVYERNILTLNKWMFNASLGVGLNVLSHIQFKESPSIQKIYWLKSSHFSVGGALNYQVGDKTTLYISPQLRKDVLDLSDKSFVKDRFYGVLGFGFTYRF